jgi:hypothetical protein
MTAWQLLRCDWRDPPLNSYLADGWEPFAVTEVEDGATVWLRRAVEPQDAGIVTPPRRPRGEIIP